MPGGTKTFSPRTRIYTYGGNDANSQSSLYTRVAEELIREVSEAPGGGPLLLPQERDLASRFKVSRSTIRQALALLEQYDLVQRRRGHGTFLAHPADEVLQVWRLRNKRLLLQQFTPAPIRLGGDYYGKVVAGILAEAKRQRQTIEVQVRPLLMDVPEQVEELPDFENIGGVVLSGAWEDQYLRLFSERHIPCVCVDYWPHDEWTDAVTVDVEAESFLICEHLAKRGYRTLGLIAFGRRRPDSDIVRFDPDIWRFIGHLRRAAAQYNILLRDEWIMTTLMGGHLVQYPLDRFFMLEQKPEAVICFDLEVGNRVLEAMRRRNLSAPRDMGLVCRDGGRVGKRQLTAVEGRAEDMGRLALQLLLDRIYRRRSVPVRQALASGLIVGDSTACRKN